MTRVCILDYGSGNVKSVYNLFASIADRIVISNDEQEIKDATHIVLPGVGAFAAAMRRIHERLPLNVLEQVVREQGKPFLGICVGMQVLAERGFEFGETPGLGWIEGSISKLESGSFPLPHIGWNNVECISATPLLTGLENSPDLYFVHSFAFQATLQDQVLATLIMGKHFVRRSVKTISLVCSFIRRRVSVPGLNLQKTFWRYHEKKSRDPSFAAA